MESIFAVLKKLYYLFGLRSIFRKNNLDGKCKLCGKCCKNLVLVNNGVPISEDSDFELMRENEPFYKNLTIVSKGVDDNLLYFSCGLLNSDNTCSIHEKRPEICKSFPNKKMFKYGGKLLKNCGYALKKDYSFKKIYDAELKKVI